MATIGINGFGRIGRMVLRAGLLQGAKINAINDPFLTPTNLAYLLKYDSTHGEFNCKICVQDDKLMVNKHPIRLMREKLPSDIDWSGSCCEYVVEATGAYTSLSDASGHCLGGAKKVIISAPSEDAPMFVCGVNLEEYSPSMMVVSNASCTTNCLAPLVKLIHEKYSIIEGLMTTIHAVTASQHTLDGPSCKNWRLGRGAFQNIIPSTTGAALAVAKVIPSLCGKLNGLAYRVPVPNVSIVDFVCHLHMPTQMDKILELIEEAAEGPLKGIIRFNEQESVSSDFVTDTHSCIFDSKLGIQGSERFFKLVAWYDNEYGYANRVLDLINHMYKVDNTPRDPKDYKMCEE